MARKPSEVIALFETQEVNVAGIYLMYFYVNGVKTPVIVDDHLPFKGSRVAFAKSRDGELWVSLLEKAWAKLHGSYARIVGGQPHFANLHLTCVPSKGVHHEDLKDMDEFFN